MSRGKTGNGQERSGSHRRLPGRQPAWY